jgi:hypothetical protein
VRQFRLLSAALALVLSGCGYFSPETSHLRVGAKVLIVKDPKDEYMILYDTDMIPPPVAEGDTAIVVEDDGGDDLRRMVKIRVTEGRSRGITGKLERNKLRPVE